MFPLFKRGAQKVAPVLRGGATLLDSQFSHFVAPLPVINGQSLKSGSHVHTFNVRSFKCTVSTSNES